MKTKVIKRKPPEWTNKWGKKARYGVKKNWKLATWCPSKKTQEVLDKLQEALMKKCTEWEACAYAWIDPTTLVKWKNEDPEFSKRIDKCKTMYMQAVKFASYERMMNLKNRDATDILMKLDKEFTDKVEVKWEITLRDAIKAIKEKRLGNSEE